MLPPATETPLLKQLISLWGDTSAWISGHLAQILLAVAVGAIIVVLLYGARLIGVWLCSQSRIASAWPKILGGALASTRLWFMAGTAAQIIVWLGRAPHEIRWPIHAIFIVTLGIQCAIWARSFILGAAEAKADATESGEHLQSAMGVIRILTTTALFIVAAILILANLGVNVSGLLAGLGIGGIAIGLAAQGIFSDLFAALSILFDKPFRQGDLIRFDQTMGTVEYIGLKSSRIRALSGEEIIISNANLLSKELRNFARVAVRRVNQTLSLVFHTPIEKVADLAGILQPVIDACEGAHFQRCGLETFGTSSLDFMLVYDIEASDQADILARKNAVNVAVLRAINDQGIAFAYPTQTTYTAGPDGKLVMPWAKPIKS